MLDTFRILNYEALSGGLDVLYGIIQLIGKNIVVLCMTEYDEPDVDYLAEMIYEHIQNKREIDPWRYNGRGFNIDYSEWPIQIDDVLRNGEMRFDADRMVYKVDGWMETDFDYEIRRRNATGGDYVNGSQILAVSGEIGVRVDEGTENVLIFDEQGTDLDVEASFRIKGESSYSGERPPF